MVALEAIRQRKGLTGANLIGCQEFGIAILFVVVGVGCAAIVDCKRSAVVAVAREISEVVAAAATLVEMSVEVTLQPHQHCHNLRPSVASWAGRLI